MLSFQPNPFYGIKPSVKHAIPYFCAVLNGMTEQRNVLNKKSRPCIVYTPAVLYKQINEFIVYIYMKPCSEMSLIALYLYVTLLERKKCITSE
jgi:hypothetical protein